jgi:hypothetical protein
MDWWSAYMNSRNSRRGVVSAINAGGVLLLCMSAIAHAQYVDPKRSTIGKDLTQIHSGLFSSNKAPFEYQTQGSWSIGYSLVKEGAGGDFYRLTLVFKNVGATISSIAPTVTLNDGDGILLPTWSYDDMYGRATQMANSATVYVPPPSRHTLSTTSTSSGTIVNQSTGQTSTFTAESTTPGPLVNKYAQVQEAVARSQAETANSTAQMNRQIGYEYLQWLPRCWLKDYYDIPPGTAAVGALLYARHSKDSRPFVVNVRVGDQQFTFRSESN